MERLGLCGCERRGDRDREAERRWWSGCVLQTGERSPMGNEERMKDEVRKRGLTGSQHGSEKCSAQPSGGQRASNLRKSTIPDSSDVSAQRALPATGQPVLHPTPCSPKSCTQSEAGSTTLHGCSQHMDAHGWSVAQS